MNKLKELRKQIGITQQAVAKKLHISRQALSFYENEKRAMPPAIMLRIADYYNVSLDELFGRIYNERTPQFNLTIDELDLIKKYRTLGEHSKKSVLRFIKGEYEDAQEKLDKLSKKTSA